MNFLEQIASYLERNNIDMLDNNVAELRHNREGYLAQRENSWKNVAIKRAEYKILTAKLEKSILIKTKEKETMLELLNKNISEVEEKLQHHK